MERKHKEPRQILKVSNSLPIGNEVIDLICSSQEPLSAELIQVFIDEIKLWIDFQLNMNGYKDHGVVIVFDSLSSENVTSKHETGYSLDMQGINLVLGRIRKAVAREIPGCLVVADRIYCKSNDIRSTDSQFGYRSGVYRSNNFLSYDESSKLAYRRFLSLESKPPFFNRVIAFDETTCWSVDEFINGLVTFDDMRKRFNKYYLSQVLEYFVDYVDGAIFLSKNGLVLQDITPYNLGVDPFKDCGVYFDYEGLCFKNEMRQGRHNLSSFQIPEGMTCDRVKVTDKEMVYQLGDCIRIIKESIESFKDMEIVHERKVQLIKAWLYSLQVSMKEELPEDRITLCEVKSKLQFIISELSMPN